MLVGVGGESSVERANENERMIYDYSQRQQDKSKRKKTHPSSSRVITLGFGIGKLGCDMLFK